MASSVVFKRDYIYVLLLVLLGLLGSSVVECGCGDGSRPICCQGKNNTCRSTGPTISKPRRSTCFCDSGCVQIGDCCLDYSSTCQAVDCIVSETWDEWGECDVSCGQGIRERTRKVLTPPENGGKPCVVTVERSICEGSKCKVPRATGLAELKETAKIIPAKYGEWRNNKKYSPYQDIRKNLFEHNAGKDLTDRPPYCATFKVTDIHTSCSTSKSADWTKKITLGSTVCVECQSFSMLDELGGRCRGHGVYQRMTHWKAVTVPGCHGKWTMTTRHQEGCRCEPDSDVSYVLI